MAGGSDEKEGAAKIDRPVREGRRPSLEKTWRLPFIPSL
jgi:hypothetical protein